MKIKIVLFFLFTSLFFSSCNTENNVVTIASSKNLWNTLIHVAEEKGYFNNHGIEVDIKYLDAGKYCMDAVLSNSADIGAVVEVNVAYLGLSDPNQDVEIVGTIVKSESSKIIADKSSGINEPEDLKGKRLALSPGTTSEVFAQRFLKKHGILDDEIQIDKIQPKNIQFSVGEGKSNAASSWEPFIYNTGKILGENAVVFSDPEIYIGYMNLAVKSDWAKSNQDKLLSFFRALKEAERYLKNNQSDAQEIMSRRINLDIEVVRNVWDNYDMSLDINEKQLSSDIEKIGKWIVSSQERYQDYKMPNYAHFINTEFLDELARE